MKPDCAAPTLSTPGCSASALLNDLRYDADPIRAREAEKTASARLQILHYNIDRFPDEIKDLRGLETLLVATYATSFTCFFAKLNDCFCANRISLLCFIDTAEDRASKTSTRPALTAAASGSSGMVIPPPVPVRVISQEDFEPVRLPSYPKLHPTRLAIGSTSLILSHRKIRMRFSLRQDRTSTITSQEQSTFSK